MTKKQHNSTCWEKIPKLEVPPPQKIPIKHEDNMKIIGRYSKGKKY